MRMESRVRRISRPVKLVDRATMRRIGTLAQKEMLGIAVDLTSGTYSTQELRRMGHPYSRRHPNPAAAPRLPINRQTGQLQDALRVVLQFAGETVKIWLKVNHPHAVVLSEKGTSKMVARGFWKELHKQTRGILRKAALRVFRGK